MRATATSRHTCPTQERQAIFDNDMKPLLVECDFDGAIIAALDKIDANATPEHAHTLNTARIVDAAVGLIGAPLLLILLVGWASWSWLRYGKDPVYLDDPSILMPAPPPDLTAASAAVVWEGQDDASGTDDGDARPGKSRRAVVQA